MKKPTKKINQAAYTAPVTTADELGDVIRKGFIDAYGEQKGGGIWSSVNNPWAGAGYGNAVASDYQLMALYTNNDLVHTAIEKNAQAISSLYSGLYEIVAKQKATQKGALRLNRKRLHKKKKSFFAVKMATDTDADIEEITDHPFLSLLDNQLEDLHRANIMRLTVNYLEVFGRAYWLLDDPENPTSMRILKPYYVFPDRDYEGNVTDYYYINLINNGTRAEPTPLGKDSVVEFRWPALADPYAGGDSPLRTVFQKAGLMSKWIDYQNASVDNTARPDAIYTPATSKDGLPTVMDKDQAKALEERFNQKFRGKGNGRLLVSDIPGTFTPLNYKPMDLGPLEIADQMKEAVCNVFHQNPAMYSKDSTYANLESAIELWAKTALTMIATAIETPINHNLLPKFGDPNLFFAFDNPVPENREFLLQEKSQEDSAFIQAGALSAFTVDEVRARFDLPPLPDNKGLALAGPPAAPVAAPTDSATPADDTPSNDLASTVGGSESLLAVQTAFYTHQIPREAAVSAIMLIFGFSEAQANSLVPDIAPDAPEDAETQAATAPKPADLIAVNDQVAVGKMSRATAINVVAKLWAITDEEAKRLVTHSPPGVCPPEHPQTKATQTACKCGGCTSVAPSGSTKAAPKLPQIPEPQPNPKLTKAARDTFKKMKAHYLKELTKKAVFGMQTKSDLPSKFVPLDEWDADLQWDSKPVIQLEMKTTANGRIKSYQKLGASPDVFEVVPQKIDEAVDAATLRFSQSTINTTTQNLNDALDNLRDQLKEGLVEGDSIALMRERVQTVFQNADDSRAETIARTETARAVHEGQRIAAKASGIVSGFKFLMSDDACDICQDINENNSEIGLDEKFNTSDQYDDSMLPAHVNCRCSAMEILDLDALDNEGDDDEQQ